MAIGIEIKINGIPLKPIDVPIDREPKKEDKIDVSGDLGLRLMNRDTLSEVEEAELVGELLSFIQKNLSKGKKSVVREFLLKHKDHLTPEIKDLISEEIKLAKK